jgi:leader peptidase (prepilin peptidase)/N-methyltransferase
LDYVTLLREAPAIWAGISGITGLLVGSFLNVVILRLPVMLERQWKAEFSDVSGTQSTVIAETFNLVTPRSRCPSCAAPIRARHNVPVLSWLLLRGRCARCRAPISIRYPVVELASGVLSAAVAWHFGFGLVAVAGLVLTWFLLALTVIDLDHQLLPDTLTLPLVWLGLLLSLAHNPDAGMHLPVAPADAIIGGAAGYLFLWMVFQLFRLLTGKEGMGYGDFKLFGALGAWLGWQMLPLILLLSAGVGAVVGVALILVRRHGRDIPIPFGPYLAGAGWVALLWGSDLVEGYLRVSGLR